jgi:hypothetical protein
VNGESKVKGNSNTMDVLVMGRVVGFAERSSGLSTVRAIVIDVLNPKLDSSYNDSNCGQSGRSLCNSSPQKSKDSWFCLRI